MEDTLKSRLVELMQKSRQAIRLYSSINKSNLTASGSCEYSDIQAREWEAVNRDLLTKLREAVEHPNQRKLAHEVFAIRDLFYFQWRESERLVSTKQQDLIKAAENGDFIKSALLSNELVVLRARFQAAQAAHHEIATVIKQVKLKAPAIELSHEQVVSEPVEVTQVAAAPQFKRSNVIPLRRVG